MVQLTFENPANLWFLLALPLLVVLHFFFLRHIKRKALLFANFRVLKRITGRRLITRNNFLLGIRMASIFFAVLAISGTVLWYEGRSNQNDFVIALDTSASMSAEDVVPTRLDAAKEDAKLFIDALDSESRVGVVSFSGIALILLVPTTDKENVKSVIDDVELLKAGGTDIPGAIITSTNLLLDNSKGRTIILITDGSNTIETFLDASMQRAISYANEHHININTIGIGSETGPIGYLPQYYNISAVYNEDNLRNISAATGGVYAKADDRDALFEAFQGIAENTTEQTLRRDLAPGLMLIALFLFFTEWILINTRFRSLP